MVTVRTAKTNIPTYEPQAPDPNPMFLEKRVYQGSSGRVYPLPFIDRIAETKTDREWTAVYLANEYIEVMILPEIGGRIHAVKDLTNGYDIFYRQEVIKPALVGLAGPWISGGVEFNWPQHHRPATFMPVEHEIEKEPDGAVTVWMGDHDPMARMRGLHGVRLRPGSSVVELRVRAYNRGTDTQTFLWWANVAARVDENYRSFFPPDVYYVADHAKRSMSAFPLCEDSYYGVPYGERAKSGVPVSETPAKFVPPGSYAANDLSWYANIPVPTSYMCMGTKEDFFGGYDYGRRAGFIHFADHHIAPGKKQWTWGNHEFGYAWDRLLSDDEGPYIELMAGVYTDNQPDFSFLQPGETKTWSQYWYPIRDIGAAHQASLDAAVSLETHRDGTTIGVSVTSAHKQAGIVLWLDDAPVFSATRALAPGNPFTTTVALPAKRKKNAALRLVVTGDDGRTLVSYAPKELKRGEVPAPATEPPAPKEIPGNDELYITGLHLEQYRHATRPATAYWLEALRRDAQDARCNTAMGRWHLRRGELAAAEPYFRTAIARLTRRNPNPADGEAYYQLGRLLLLSGRADEAYDALYKACWNREWQAAGYHLIAEIDCVRGDFRRAADHLERALRVNVDNLRARNLLVMVRRKLGRESEALLRETLALDPLDSWAGMLSGKKLACDAHACLDLAHDLARAGFFAEADAVLVAAAGRPGLGAAPLVAYTRARFAQLAGRADAKTLYRAASKTDATYCFPAREEDILVLEAAMKADPSDALAPYLAGNWLYDRRRHEEAIRAFEKAVKLNPKNAVAWRNLGIGYFNVSGLPKKARAAYDKACAAKPADARLFYERDQLRKRLGDSPEARLRDFEKHAALVSLRDDLTVEYGELLNQVGCHVEALVVVSGRRFQPWEGGEGRALALHVRTHLALGRAALAAGDVAKARAEFEAALDCPAGLGESRHLLANASDIRYLLGLTSTGAERKRLLGLAADFRGDFRDMSVVAYSDMTFYSALALAELGRKAEAKKLLEGLAAYARDMAKTPAKIDYFATSLPTMLLFDDDLQARRVTDATFLLAQAQLGLGKKAPAKTLLRKVLERDPNHAGAADLFASL